MPEWTVYLLRCADGSFYCGVAKDVANRLLIHNAGRGSRYVRSRRPAVVVWIDPGYEYDAALRRAAHDPRRESHP